MSIYLQQLTVRLAAGIGRLPSEIRTRHSDYLLAAQRDDGGFAGRQGSSDLYYTSFALRGLSILGQLYGETADRAAQFLSTQMGRHQTVVDFFSLLYAATLLNVSAGVDLFQNAEPNWQDRVAELLSKLRRDDGGYAKAPKGTAGSTYHTFLVLLVMQLIDRQVPDPAGIINFLARQHDPQGGWREIRASKRAGTNPTAAAVASLKILQALDVDGCNETVDFLIQMQTDEGGIRANTRIPIADLLSSFTGGLTLADLNAFDEIEINAFRQFVNSLQLPAGGFQAAAWDQAHDVEYTFYGLGCLALLENHGR